MLRPTLYRLAALAFLLGAPAAVRGQEPAPVSLRAVSLAADGLYELSYAWRYHPGDDPRWADPAFDDGGWERVEPLLSPGKLPSGRWPGSGWFRRHVRIDPGLYGKTVTIRVATPGATTVFLDGAPVMSTGVEAGGKPAGGVWREVVLSPRPDHVLAVRHRLAPAALPAGSGNLGFLLSIQPRNAAAFQQAMERRQATVLILFTAVPAFLAAFLALLHLALFLSYRKARENLFYALGMAASSSVAACDLMGAWISSESGRMLALRLVFLSVLALTFFILLTYYAVRTRTFPRTWIAFAAGGVALAALTFLLPHPSPWIWYVYFGLAVIEVIRVEATGETVEREGVKILLRGFMILAAVIVLQVLISLGVVPPVAGLGNVYQFGLLAFEMAMSLFLARGFARTSLNLERRLDEVRALSEQVLAQERAAHELELDRRLLDAENRRKTSEIEAARALQLSMLPTALPAVEGLETAAAMITASEVGGDYYDFRVAADGSLVVAFGDAAGHGVAAGIMVTAIKALFSTLGGGESLPAVLAECDRVLRGMQVRPLHMCLTLARVTPRAVTVCSAAMPPVLIHRAASGEVEELGLGGRPVGSRLAGGWTEQSAPLAPGDTLLFASDGFAEQLDPAEDSLGYERMEEAFRAAAGLPARDLVERLLAQVAAWRGEREQGDDVTFVAVAVVS